MAKKDTKKQNNAQQDENLLTPEQMMELAVLEEELYLLKKEKGLLKEKKGFWKFIDRYFHGDAADAVEEPKQKEPCIVNRKKYFWFLMLTGWCGGHMFYAKKYGVGALYLALFWTGFPLASSIVDWLIWLPKKPDENGNIEL